MLIRCDVHGDIEATPNMNGVVHCPACLSRKMEKFLKDMKSDFSMTGPEALKTSLDNFEFFFTCHLCGSEFSDGHSHTDNECVVHRIMNS